MAVTTAVPIDADSFSAVLRGYFYPILRARLGGMGLPLDLVEVAVPIDDVVHEMRTFRLNAFGATKWEILEHLRTIVEERFRTSPHVYWYPYSERWELAE